jgi:hypothetical protein
MVLPHVFSSLLVLLGLTLNGRAFINNFQVNLSMAQYVAWHDQGVVAEGFAPPNDEERPGSTVG